MKIVHDKIEAVRGNLITVKAQGPMLGELALVQRRDGRSTLASVLRFSGDRVVLQVFESARGIATDDKVTFLKRGMQVPFGDQLLGRCFNGSALPIDGGPVIKEEPISIAQASFNPVKRIVPKEMVRTNIPMIDVYNCLVKSQKIPIFSQAGEPYNALLMRIANQTNADVVIIGGMGLTFEDYQAFFQNAQDSGVLDRTSLFIHKATDPVVECVLIPDLALACGEQFALKGKNVLVLLTDMTAFADALKEISITMDQIPSNRGYPGSLYSDLASRYEKAVEIDGSGSITIITVTTMPGGDITHPVPDNTGYITEGQFYLHGGTIDPFGSLSRLKQLVIGKVTRQDHAEIANTTIRLFAESKKARERQSMGFRLSKWDEKLLAFAADFEQQMMHLEVNLPLEEALDGGWQMLAKTFEIKELGMKEHLVSKYWPKEGSAR